MQKRLISWFLTLAIIISVLPVPPVLALEAGAVESTGNVYDEKVNDNCVEFNGDSTVEELIKETSNAEELNAAGVENANNELVLNEDEETEDVLYPSESNNYLMDEQTEFQISVLATYENTEEYAVESLINWEKNEQFYDYTIHNGIRSLETYIEFSGATCNNEIFYEISIDGTEEIYGPFLLNAEEQNVVDLLSLLNIPFGLQTISYWIAIGELDETGFVSKAYCYKYYFTTKIVDDYSSLTAQEVAEGMLSIAVPEESHNWVSNFEIEAKNTASSSDVVSLVKFAPDVAEYTIDYANYTPMDMYLTPTSDVIGKEVYYQFLVDGQVREGDAYKPKKIEGTNRINVTSSALAYHNIAWGGQKLTLLVGTLNSGAENLSAETCNVYQFNINMQPSLTSLMIRDAASGGKKFDLTPEFHRQRSEYTTASTTTEVRIVMQHLGGTKVTIPDGTKATDKLTQTVYNLDLSKYVEQSTKVAKVPVQLSFESNGATYTRTIMLNIAVPEESHNWVSNFEIEAKNTASSSDVVSLVKFAPDIKEYNVELAMDAVHAVYLTATQEAVEQGLYYQVQMNGQNRIGDVYRPQKIDSTKEIEITNSAFKMDDLDWTEKAFTLLVGQLESNGESIDANNSVAYFFNVKKVPSIQQLTVSSSDGSESYELMPEFHVQDTAYNTEVTSTLIRLDISHTEGIELSLPNSEIVYGSNTQSNITVDLRNYATSGTNVAIIPVSVYYKNESVVYKRDINLTLTWTQPNMPTISNLSEDVECDKGAQVSIYVEIAPLPEDGVVTYQWYQQRSQLKPLNVVLDDYAKVDGATASSFSPSTNTANVNMWYYCKVTYTTPEGKAYTTVSDYVRVWVNLSYVNKPTLIKQPGTCTLGGFNNTVVLDGTYKTEYYKGEHLNPIFTQISEIELGTKRVITWYYNTTDSNSNGTLLDAARYRQASGCYGYRINHDFGIGTYYIYCIVKDVDENDEANYAETVSETCKITFKPHASNDFKGDGTENSPYLLKTQEDLQLLQRRVNEEGISYAGAYFALANDIMLPDNWTPIGCTKDGSMDIQKGLNLNAFSGIIDGKNHLLTVPSGSLPLLGYVNGATVRNLNIYGTQIAGAGLVNNYTGPDLSGNAVTIENVRLKSGTQTLNSGLVRSVFGGNTYASASAGFTVTIRNCVAEDGVTIGYTGKESKIGTFADKINGTIENCTSNATVKGKNYVGGLIGTMDNAMGKCTVRNSSFHGTVSGSNYVGGIIGGGYSNDNSAPNGGRPNLIGNTVDGTVTGGSCVGGITGGDQYVAQTRANVAHSVTGNTFTGTVSGSQYVGGIIGYYNSLNVYDNVAGNKYSGADKGVGYVKYIDTSYKNPKLMDGTVAFNTGKTTVGLPDVQWNTWKEGLNRDDDPLGVDAENLARKIGGSSQLTCIELTVSGNYKTEYDFGENLDLTGIILTASWDDGTASTVSLDDVKISGYDKNKTGEQTVILTYGAAKAYITVRVTPKSSKITVNVSIRGDSHHKDPTSNGGPHGLARGGLTTWASESNVEADTAETVWDVLQRVAQKHGITFTADSKNTYGTVYIKAVNGLGEFDNGKNSGWMYTVNGTHPEKGVAARYVKNGDTIILHYTDDYTYEEGGDNYGKTPPKGTTTGGGSTGGGTSTITAADRNKAAAVDKLIEKIGTVTKDSGPAIEAARKAFDGLTDAQKRLVTNTKKLTDAEKAYAQLTATPEDKEKAQKVIDLIKKLTNVTLDSEKDIQAARKAYDALTDLQKPLVDNYDVLTTAETKLAMLKAMGKVSDPYISTGDYMEKLGTPGIGSIGGEWMVIGLARSGRTVPSVEDYYQKAVEYVQQSIDPDTGRLHKAKSTDNSRMILALTAIGKDVTNVGGYNLLAGLSDLEFVKYQGNNGPIWALLALDSGNYPVPSGGTTTRQALIDEILSVQTSDGGWAISGDRADSDMTGMALTALAPYYKKDPTVKQAIDKAIARLSEMQDEDGGYSTSYDGTTKIATSESISQVVTALSALGINADTDPRFVKNGNSVIDALLRYYVKGGGFKHVMDGEIDGMGTEQAYYALTAYYRFLSGKTNLYDMTDIIDMGGDVVTVEPTVPAATEPAQAAQTNIPWWIIAVCIFGGAGWGVVIGIVLVPKLNKKKD